MTSTELVDGTGGRVQVLDPVWHLAFPAYHFALFGYGLAAAVFPVVPLGEGFGYDRVAVFGVVMSVVTALMLVGDVLSIKAGRVGVVFWSSIAFMVLMGFYCAAFYLSVVHHEVGARPGSTFTPLVFGIFPFFQVLVLARSGRIWKKRARK